MKRPIPSFKNDEEAERFVATADLADYDLTGGEFVRFEFKRKDKTISLRLPESPLQEVQSRAKNAGIPYQRFIRMAIERAIQSAKPR